MSLRLVYNLNQLKFIIQVKNSRNFNLNYEKSSFHVVFFVRILEIQFALEEVFMI